jgi:Chlorophyll A-B binding protein
MGTGQDGIVNIPALGLLQIFLSIGWWELKVWKQVPGSTPGDFGIPYISSIKTEAEKERYRAAELNNGRAAQMGLLAMLVHEGLDGKPFIFF